jgi:hypothetical protein
VVAACALAGGFGALWGRVEVDALKLWVDARAREEVKTYEDAFGDYRTQAFVVTAKRAPTLASREAFLELKDWHDWMYGLEAVRGGVVHPARFLLQVRRFRTAHAVFSNNAVGLFRGRCGERAGRG